MNLNVWISKCVQNKDVPPSFWLIIQCTGTVIKVQDETVGYLNFFDFQNHAFVKKTEEEYEKVVNFGDWVCKVMKIQPPS